MFNQQKYILECLKNLFLVDHSTKTNKIIALNGKAGVGKTYIACELMHILNSKNIPTCYIVGDQFCNKRDYYCIKQSLSQISEIYEKKKQDSNLIAGLVGELPKIGEISRKIVSDKLNYRNINQSQKAFFLKEEERNIVYRLNYFFDKNESVIICDNFQYFDIKSLELIYIFLKNSSQFDFMVKCHFLLIVTEEHSFPTIVNQIMEEFTNINYELPPITFDEMDLYLDSFHIGNRINYNIKHILYKLSKGHLEVIKQIALKIINDQVPAGQESQYYINNILEHLIIDNLKKLGNKGIQISYLLEYASLAGKKFLDYEIEKTFELQKQDYLNLMNYPKEMEYIKQDKLYSYFSNEIIQIIFRNKAYLNNFQYFEKMKVCVKQLFPGDYARRIEIELQLQNRYTAAILIILLYFKNNFQTADEHQNYNSIIKEFSDIEDFYNLLNEAIAFYNIRNYVDAIRHLNYISNMYPVQLLVVRDILKSISLTKLLDNDYRNDAITCLEGYTFENIKEEGELYLQILLARISSFTHNGDIKQAQKCERQIYQYLQDRLSYDEDAKTTLHILKRKSNCMHECLISERYIKESVEYFKPLPGHTAALNPVQYLMSLANHSGILIECGRFSESILEINNAYTFIKINPMLEFPRLQIVDNNFLIAVYLNNYNMKNEILNSYKKLVDISENADNIFINSNYSALLAVNGKTEEAYTLLQKTKRQLSNNRENFYEISIENNLLILELFNKRYSNAQLLLDQLLKAIHGVIDESYYRKKYELLQMAINQQIEIPLDKIDTFLFDYCPHYQEAWDYWGHSFDFTALYYWSDL